jgi:hypothetical protein
MPLLRRFRRLGVLFQGKEDTPTIFVAAETSRRLRTSGFGPMEHRATDHVQRYPRVSLPTVQS